MTITRSHFVRCIALVLMPTLMACYTWELAYVAPQTLVEESRPKGVRVTPQRRPPVTLWDPFVRGDSMVGRLQRKDSETAAVLLEDVVTVRTWEFSPQETLAYTALTAGVIALLVTALYFIDFGIRMEGQGIQ